MQGRISVRSTVDERVQTLVNEALETGLALYERRHPSEGADPGLSGRPAERGWGDPGRGGRPASLPGPVHPVL
jgi:hypothetical protein